jgi:signal transduction histidine kinase
LTYAITFTLLAVISFSIFYYRIYSVAMERVDDELLDDTEVYAALLEARGLEAFKDRLAEEAETEDPDEEFYHLIDFKGKTLFASDVTAWDLMEIKGTGTSLQDDQISPVFKTIPAPGGDHKARSISAVIGPDTILQIGETLEETDEYMEIFRNLFVVLTVFLVIISTLIGWYLARRALIDMEQVTQTAEEISNGSYHRRVDVKGQLKEIKRLSSTFNKMLDRIQGLLNSMKEINDNIAHDLRSPLARIRGIAEMTLVGNTAVDDYKDMAVSTMEECDSLIDMVNTMLDITEAEAGVNGIVEEEFDLAAMITGACELFQPAADQKKIEINCNIPQTLLFKGARKKMQRVVTNLLENAIKYTPEHGTVAVSVADSSGEIQIDFKDTGIGISEEDLPHIFERFYRCDRSRTQGGVGLGLSLAKAFAVSMKGMIQVNSVINQGSTFTLKFAQ